MFYNLLYTQGMLTNEPCNMNGLLKALCLPFTFIWL